MPCPESEAEHTLSRGVAETLLHETAGRGLRLWGLFGDCRHDDCYLQWLRLERCVEEATPLLRTAACLMPACGVWHRRGWTSRDQSMLQPCSTVADDAAKVRNDLVR